MDTKFVQSDGKTVLLAHARVEPIKGPIEPERSYQKYFPYRVGVKRRSKNTLQKPWPELVLGHYDKSKHGRFTNSSPYAVAFVYAKSGNIVVRGMPDEVQEVLNKERRFGNCVYYLTFWGKEKYHGLWCGTPGIHVTKKSFGKRTKFHVEIAAGIVGGRQKWVRRYFRRMPRRWIKLYDMVEPCKKLLTATPDEPVDLDLIL